MPIYMRPSQALKLLNDFAFALVMLVPLLMLHRIKPDVSLALTQEKMARSLGVHRPSLTHLAQLLRDKKVIAYTRGKLHITNSAELKRYACPCHTC